MIFKKSAGRCKIRRTYGIFGYNRQRKLFIFVSVGVFHPLSRRIDHSNLLLIPGGRHLSDARDPYRSDSSTIERTPIGMLMTDCPEIIIVHY